MSFLSGIKTKVLNLVFPLSCAGCGAQDMHLCAPCAAAIPMYAPACFVCKKLVPAHGVLSAGRTCTPCRKKSCIYAFFSPFSYGHPAIRSLLHNLKYRRMHSIAPILGNLVVTSLAFYRVALPKDTLLIPVPLHPSRERMRGFNQSLLITKVVGENLGISTRGDLLKKVKKTRPQMKLTREERLRNVLDVFSVSDTDAIYHKTCILMDDIKTTGATLESAARALKRAGAKKIFVITVAR